MLNLLIDQCCVVDDGVAALFLCALYCAVVSFYFIFQFEISIEFFVDTDKMSCIKLVKYTTYNRAVIARVCACVSVPTWHKKSWKTIDSYRHPIKCTHTRTRLHKTFFIPHCNLHIIIWAVCDFFLLFLLVHFIKWPIITLCPKGHLKQMMHVCNKILEKRILYHNFFSAKCAHCVLTGSNRWRYLCCVTSTSFGYSRIETIQLHIDTYKLTSVMPKIFPFKLQRTRTAQNIWWFPHQNYKIRRTIFLRLSYSSTKFCNYCFSLYVRFTN